MRRKDRELLEREQIEPIIKACKVCRLAMIADGKPYVVPMNFGYEWDETGLTLYFHSGVKGKKIEALRQNPAVCFEMDIEDGLTGSGDLACKYSYAFSSVVGEGNVVFVQTEDEKCRGFDAIMRHLTGRDGWDYSSAHLSVTEVLAVRADTVEGSRKPMRG